MDKVDPKTGLTGKQVGIIQKHWATVWKDWEKKHGVSFFMCLFKEYPEMKNYFKMFDNMSMDEIQKSAKLHAHILNFGNQFNALVQQLGNADVLVVLIQKLAVNHYARSIDTPQFKEAFKCFLKYAAANSTVDKPTADAWTKCLETVASVVDATNRAA